MMSDLHFHSACSDGKLSVSGLSAIILERQLKYCALTDHDTVEGHKELKELLEGSATTLIAAAELTALYRKNEVHILAYDFDIDGAATILKERNDLVRKQKEEELGIAVKLFRAVGFTVSDGLVPSPKKPVGLTVALDVYNNPANKALLIDQQGRFMDHQVFFDTYQAEGKSCATPRSGVGFEWLVDKFKGVAKDLIIAHPFVPVSFFVKPLDEQSILELIDLGATGIEVYHDKTSREQIELLRRIVDEKGLHFTGGSDFHGKNDDMPLGHYNSDIAVPKFKLARHIF